MSIFISTGEISGDIYAAKLAESLHKILKDEKLWGMGGDLARGIDREWDNDALHIMGIAKILKTLPKLLKLRSALAQAVAARNPKAVIVIDSPDFHIPLLAKIRSLGYKGPAIYVCPPTIWAWRSGRAKYLRRYCDLCLPLFNFEEKVLEQHHVKSFWCGHPLVDDFARSVSAPELPDDPLRVALLPGSRRSEILSLMPVLEETALQLRGRGLHPVFSVAPGLDPESRRLVIENASGIEAAQTSGRALMSASRFVIGASGTAAVEAMFLNKFMIVVYRGSAFEWGIYKLVTNIPLISIPNVLAGRMMYPELLQKDATTKKIMACADRYIGEEVYAREIHEQIARNMTMMRPSPSQGETQLFPALVTTDRWAHEIAKMITN